MQPPSNGRNLNQFRWSAPTPKELARLEDSIAFGAFYSGERTSSAAKRTSPSTTRDSEDRHDSIDASDMHNREKPDVHIDSTASLCAEVAVVDMTPTSTHNPDLATQALSDGDNSSVASEQGYSSEDYDFHTEFDEYRPPSEQQLIDASKMELLDEDGNPVRFGDLYPTTHDDVDTPTAASNVDGSAEDRLQPKTVLFFIRLLACGQCQDYMTASVARLNPDVIAAHNVRVVIISNGSWRGIKRYRQIMKCPFPMYVDPTLDLYRHLEMSPPVGTVQTLIGLFKGPKERPPYHQHPVFMQTLRGLKNAARMGVLDIGSPKQMGGEFILLPGYKCAYAHRMPNKFNHALAVHVMKKAGVKFPERHTPYGPVSNCDEFTEEQLAQIQKQDRVVREWQQHLNDSVQRV